VERPAWLARSRSTIRSVTEDGAYWRQLMWMSLVRCVRRIVVNKAEGIPVVWLLLENDTVF
jgi:hypothetical protein